VISRIEGQLVEVRSGSALVKCGHITYDVLIPAADRPRLSALVDQPVTFQTLHYLEGQGQGTSFIPRLIGFATEDDRAFFELFTTVKGMGMRKALRALQLPFAEIATAIGMKDIDLLKSMPEIGKRTAETIVVTLHDKVERFATGAGLGAGGAGPIDEHGTEIARDAAAVLSMLGEPKMYATQLVERALAADATIDSADELVAAAFRLKE